MPKKAKEEIVKKETKVTKTISRSQKSTTKKTTKKTTNSSTKNSSQNTVKTTPKSTTKTTVKSKTPPKEKFEVLEYYDLPYRYNHTVVKVLAQTPTRLFVYWELAEEDKKQYQEQYGMDFFTNTRPVLCVFNLTKNYQYEIPINDFANSWYLAISDANCKYRIELARKPIQTNTNVSIPTYIPVSTSNEMEAPNNHILWEGIKTTNSKVVFKNVKTQCFSTKTIPNIPIGAKKSIPSPIYFYEQIDKKEHFYEFSNNLVQNPSSKSNFGTF